MDRRRVGKTLVGGLRTDDHGVPRLVHEDTMLDVDRRVREMGDAFDGALESPCNHHVEARDLLLGTAYVEHGRDDCHADGLSLAGRRRLLHRRRCCMCIGR